MQPIKNPLLTHKALQYIFRNGRNTFDELMKQLIEEGKNLYKEGWIKKDKPRKRKK